MPHDLFISYSSKDKPIADGICASLESAGIRCWIAPRDIAPGEDWPTAITTAISHSKVMVLVFSANSNTSKDVGREIILAANADLAIIPFKIDNAIPEPGKQYYLARTHWLEAMNPPTKEQKRSLVERVKMIIPPLADEAVVPPISTPPAQKEQPAPRTPAVQKNWFKHAYLWIGAALVLVVLGVILWPKLWGTPASPIATPTATVTETTLPTLAPTKTAVPPATATVKPGVGSTTVRYRDGMTMVYVPAGEFNMGSNQGNPDEMPVHSVSLGAFWIDQTEVTNAMILKCLIAGVCGMKNDSGSSTRTDYFRNSQYDDYPTVNLDWEEAEAYCRWVGARLPTEAEWEMAARGTDGRTYPWGEESPNENLLNFNMNVTDTMAVGSYPAGASPFGALDMAGNVWEYVADYYSADYYSISPTTDPGGPVSGNYRVIRGGAANSFASAIRSTVRNKFTIRQEDDFIGFRCADDATP